MSDFSISQSLSELQESIRNILIDSGMETSDNCSEILENMSSNTNCDDITKDFSTKDNDLTYNYDLAIKQYDILFHKWFAVSDADLEQEVLECMTMFASLHDIIKNDTDLNSYKTVDDIPTDSLKYILLPAYYGLLTRRIVSGNKYEILTIAQYFLREFISNCKSLGMTNAEVPLHVIEGGPFGYEDARSYINKSDSEKLRKEEEQYDLALRFHQLKPLVDSNEADDDTKRDYYLSMINYEILNTLDILQRIKFQIESLIRLNPYTLNKKGLR